MHDNLAAVNAALCNLTTGQDIPTSAQIVAEYMQHFSNQHRVFSFGYESTREPQSFTEENRYGLKKELTGHFKIWKEDSCINFNHYWSSDRTTRSACGDYPCIYTIKYSALTGEAKKFGHDNEISFSIGRLSIGIRWFPKWVWIKK